MSIYTDFCEFVKVGRVRDCALSFVSKSIPFEFECLEVCEVGGICECFDPLDSDLVEGEVECVNEFKGSAWLGVWEVWPALF